MDTKKQHISLLDDSYREDQTNFYKLYIELSNNGIKHTIFNTTTNTFIGLEEYSFSGVHTDYSLTKPVKEILTTNPIYQKEFASTHVSIINNRSTLIPAAVFKGDKLPIYHQFNFTKQDADLFFADPLVNIAAYNVYSIPSFVTELFSDINNVSFKHFSSARVLHKCTCFTFFLSNHCY